MKDSNYRVFWCCFCVAPPPPLPSNNNNKKNHFSCNKTFRFEVLTTCAGWLPVSSDFTVENSPSEMAIFVTLVTSVLSFLSLVSRGHDGDFNVHIGQTEKKRERQKTP